MDSRSFYNLAFLALFLLSHQPLLCSSRSPFLSREDAASPPGGMCSAAVTIHGYKCHEFQVATADGYILSVQRIPEGRRGGGGGQKRPPVLLQHGVLVGTLIALASFSEGKQVDKVKSAVLLSPIAYLSYMNTALGVLVARSFVGEITTIFGLAEFNPRGEPEGNLLRALCASSGVDCLDLLSAFTGKNCCLNASTVDLFLKNEPQSTSTKNLVHMAQTVRDGRLAKYDYGNPNFNLEHYGETRPPVYDLSRIPHDLPLFLSYGGQDALSDVRDVATLLDSLKLHDVGKLHVQYIKDYAHADFIIGITAKDLVYNQVVSFFRNLL